jgi:hypothetical protein
MRCRASIHGSPSSVKISTRKVGFDKMQSSSDLIATVLGSHTRLFKDVFAQAQSNLMDVFGMQLVELPKAEKVTLRQKRGMHLQYLEIFEFNTLQRLPARSRKANQPASGSCRPFSPSNTASPRSSDPHGPWKKTWSTARTPTSGCTPWPSP